MYQLTHTSYAPLRPRSAKTLNVFERARRDLPRSRWTRAPSAVNASRWAHSNARALSCAHLSPPPRPRLRPPRHSTFPNCYSLPLDHIDVFLPSTLRLKYCLVANSVTPSTSSSPALDPPPPYTQLADDAPGSLAIVRSATVLLRPLCRHPCARILYAHDFIVS